MGLSIFFEQEYMCDYFMSIVNFLHDKKIDITLATPFLLTTKVKHTLLNKRELKQHNYPLIWIISDAIDYVNSNTKIIYTQLHAGYGEFEFIPNVRTLEKADFLFCATVIFPTIKQHDLLNLLPSSKISPLAIAPIGYPKLDYISSKNTTFVKNSIILALTTISDNPFDTESCATKTTEALLHESNKNRR